MLHVTGNFDKSLMVTQRRQREISICIVEWGLRSYQYPIVTMSLSRTVSEMFNM